MHELTHGLGLVSSLVDYHQEFNRTISYLAPPILQSESLKYSYFAPLNVYDNLLLSTKPFRTLIEVISGTPKREMSPPDYMNHFESSKRIFAGLELMNLASNDTFVATRNKEGIRLYSPHILEQGSSISHVKKYNINGSEFLMTPSIAEGVTLSAMMKKFNMTKVYGPKIQAIMENLGYSTSDNPREMKLDISLTFGTDAYAPEDEYPAQELAKTLKKVTKGNVQQRQGPPKLRPDSERHLERNPRHATTNSSSKTDTNPLMLSFSFLVILFVAALLKIT